MVGKALGKTTRQLTTEQLIELCQEGDPGAQQRLYHQFARKMAMVCHRYIRDARDVEEIVLGGFLKVYQHIGKFEYRGEHSLGGWIKRIMVNESLMFLRKKNALKLVEDAEMEVLSPHTSQDGNLEAKDLFHLVRQLPTGYRTVFNLYAIEGYSHAEIAEMLQINVNTSKSQLSKARGWLKKRIDIEESTHNTNRQNREE